MKVRFLYLLLRKNLKINKKITYTEMILVLQFKDVIGGHLIKFCKFDEHIN